MLRFDSRDKQYLRIVDYINELYDEFKSWDDVRNITKFSDYIQDLEDRVGLVATIKSYENPINKELWFGLVEDVKIRSEENKHSKMGFNVRNSATISVDSKSAWQTYKSKLINNGWTIDSIENLKSSAFEILQNLTFDNKNYGAVKGLAIGNVQSGKTANMEALMAMAADNGFNYFILLSGVIENLRQQTSNRLYEDLNSKSHNLQWKQIENPSLRSSYNNHNMTSFDFSENSTFRYYSVVLKNSKRLDDFIKWLLQSDSAKAKQMKILVIDDEADQASINTNKLENENPTKINKLITSLVNTDKVKAMNYVAYTATPYANVLNDSNEKSLYPKDFIVMLDTNSEYIGPEEIFSLQDPESQPKIDIIREIPNDDKDTLDRIQKNQSYEKIPSSLKEAINWFLISVSAMRALNIQKPISMLIHTSFKIQNHKIISERVVEYLKDFKLNYDDYKIDLKNLYEREKRYLSRQHFLDGMGDYSNSNEVPDYPNWDEVEPFLQILVDLDKNEFLSHIPIGEEGQPKYHKGIHLVIDNSDSSVDDQIVRLVYPNNNQMPKLAPAFIVIGGNTLSRGLTLEGLVSTYFVRNTNQADTLMQMGRWFGYRIGYEIFPRVWLDRSTTERFEFVAQLNKDLRDEVMMYSVNGLSPIEYAPKVKNSPSRNFMRITSNNKQQSAIEANYDFSGYSVQTVYFENNIKVLRHNFDLTVKFLNSLSKPEVTSSRLIWRNIEKEKVRMYLNQYQSSNVDKKMASLDSILDWIDSNSQDSDDSFTNWNVILSSTEGIESTSGNDNNWNVHGYSPNPVVRTKLNSRSTDKIANIGVLRAPIDYVYDANISEDEYKDFKGNTNAIYYLRKKYNLDRTPLLVIYRIDKHGKVTNEGSTKRSSLDFPIDPIGISLLMPGFSKSNQPITHVQIKLSDVVSETYEGDY